MAHFFMTVSRDIAVDRRRYRPTVVEVVDRRFSGRMPRHIRNPEIPWHNRNTHIDRGRMARFPQPLTALVAVISAALIGGLALHVIAADSGIVPGPIPAEVIQVVDGDTIAVRARIWLGQEVETHVRIAGIDAPEIKGRCEHERQMAEEARSLLVKSLGEGRVLLREVRNDKYGGRVIAEVDTAKGENVAELMLRSGLARLYDGGRRQSWCSPSEAER